MAHRIDQLPSLPPSLPGRQGHVGGRKRAGPSAAPQSFSSSSGPSATSSGRTGDPKPVAPWAALEGASGRGRRRAARQLLKCGAFWGGPSPRRKQGRPTELPLWKEKLGRGATRRRGFAGGAGSQPKAAYRSQRAQPAEARYFAKRGRDRAAAGGRRSGLPGSAGARSTRRGSPSAARSRQSARAPSEPAR